MNKEHLKNKISAFTLAEGATHVDRFTPFRQVAFTLAEVLITLGIIGVVAAMTIPTLMNKTQDAEYVTAMKKAYSVLSQATQRVTLENGDYTNWTVTDGSEDDINNLFNMYKPYLSIIKDCGNSDDGCWVTTKTLDNGSALYSNSYGFGLAIHIFTLKDGMNVSMDVWGGNIYEYFGVNSDTSVIVFFVDVNGNKKPNVLGKDVFAFVVTSKGVIAAGSDNDSANCKKNGTSSSGYDCAAKVLREGKIDY